MMTIQQELRLNKNLVDQIISKHFAEERDVALLTAFRAMPMAVYEYRKSNPTGVKEQIESPDDFNDRMSSYSKLIPKILDGIPKSPESFGANKAKTMVFLNLYNLYFSKNIGLQRDDKLFFFNGLLMTFKRMSLTNYEESLKPIYEHTIRFLENEIKITETELQPSPHLYFVWHASQKALDGIADYLKYKNIVADKRKFIELLSGSNIKMKIPNGKLTYYIAAIRYLVIEKEVLKMNKGKGYLEHILHHLEDFSFDGKKSKPSQIVANWESQHKPDQSKLNELLQAIEQRLK